MPAMTPGGWPYILPADHPMEYPGASQQLASMLDDQLPPVDSVPIGAIIAYAGTVAPPGWHLCDGTAHGSQALADLTGNWNTADLRSRFIVAAGAAYAQGSTGGQAQVTLTEAQMPSHRHSQGTALYTDYNGTNGDGTFSAGTKVTKFSAGHGATITQYTGGGQPHENMPPYYALTYIVRK